ncbi:hypothetical protein PIB30_059437 [Stylosanthes scabra]|uniref:GIY-YIG domain-containing protein n=1 Tax=Stylosanthes scabra TaxID=79078 RepID=A0ABU6VM96_9FABA|nr:hypothetical protein [Stylosanthes scabra]
MRTISGAFRCIKRPILSPNLIQIFNSNRFHITPQIQFPIKTYVGVTTNLPRRLKQHKGDPKGGAKASRAGRPWICACLICGFADWSEVGLLESINYKDGA